MHLGLEPVFPCASASAYEERLFRGESAALDEAMEKAGAAIALALRRDFAAVGSWPERPRFLVVAGKGNNAGDAFIALRHLLAALPGARATVLCAFPAEAMGVHAGPALRRLLDGHGERVQLVSISDDWRSCLSGAEWDVLLDGLFGMQFRPPMRAPFDSLVGFLNHGSFPVRMRCAIDLPSGVGDHSAAEPLRADYTYVMGTMKRPALEVANHPATGRIRYLRAGFPPVGVSAADLYRPDEYFADPEMLGRLAGLRPAGADKRAFGHVFIIAGSVPMPGAAALSALGSLRAGAGLITVCTPGAVVGAVASLVPEAMWTPVDPTPDGALPRSLVALVESRLERMGALVIGPGLPVDENSVSTLAGLVGRVDVPVVIDASALRGPVLEAVARRAPESAPVLLTPHAGEFRRLAPTLDPSSDEDLRAFAREIRAVVLLKGPVTRISDGIRLVHVFGAGPVLARGGSGDVLAGILGSLLAGAAEDPLLQAARGALWHARAGDLLARREGETSARVLDLPSCLGPAVRNIKGD